MKIAKFDIMNREYNISYGCTTDDDIVHVSEFTGTVNDSTQLSNVFSHIITELTEEGKEIESLNITLKVKK